MQDSQPVKSKLLPSNAYTTLEPGEVYQPVVPADDLRPEVTLWSIGVGVAMVVLFTAACAYMALRAGNAIEASIPIAILAIFFGKLRQINSTILENVMVQSVGQAAGVVDLFLHGAVASERKSPAGPTLAAVGRGQR